LAIGAQIECEQRYGRLSPAAVAFYLVQAVLLGYFVLEFVLDLYLHGRAVFVQPPETRRPNGLWGMLVTLRFSGFFDLFVIASGICYLWVMMPAFLGSEGEVQRWMKVVGLVRLLQILWLKRAVTLLGLPKQLMMLVLSLALSLKRVFLVVLLLFVLIYISAVFCCSQFGVLKNEELNAFFGTLWLSMYSHFKLMTLEQWPDILASAMEVNVLWAPYFIFFIFLTNLTLVNLVTGLIIESVIENAQDHDRTWEEKLVEEMPFLEVMEEILIGFDADSDGLDKHKFIRLINDHLFQDVLAIYGISLRLSPDTLFEILDVHNEGRLSVKEVAFSLLKLRGSDQALHLLIFCSDLQQETCRFSTHIAETKEILSHQYHEKVKGFEERVQDRVARLFAKKQGPLEHQEHIGGDGDDCHHAQSFIGSAEDLLPLLESASSQAQALQKALKAAELELVKSLDEEKALEAQLHDLQNSSSEARDAGKESSDRDDSAGNWPEGA